MSPWRRPSEGRSAETATGVDLERGSVGLRGGQSTADVAAVERAQHGSPVQVAQASAPRPKILSCVGPGPNQWISRAHQRSSWPTPTAFAHIITHPGLMINTRKKILKEKGATPTSLEEEVAKALFDIEVSPSCDFKAELREIYLSGATEIEVGKGGAAVIVHIPFRAWKFAKKIQSRLIKELEKKFSQKHVILVANRTILDKDFRRKGMKVRPRSRTLTAVHEAILEDVVGPTEIVGKRTRIGTDGSKILKILLDPWDKDKEHVDNKLPVFSAVYKKLTTKEAIFSFPQV